MKKLLLTIGTSALSFGSLLAQNPFVIYDGTPNAFLSGNFYKFDGISAVKDSALLESSDKFLYVAGSATGYYAGGIGNAAYSGPNVKVPLPYTGEVVNTTFGFGAFTYGSSTVKAKVQLKTPTALFGYEFDLATAAISAAPFSVPVASFKTVVADNPTGPAITDAELKMVEEIQLVFTCTDNLGACSFQVGIDNIVLVDATKPLGLADVLASTSEEIVSAYDMLGNLIGTGKINDLALENGRVYIIKSSSETKKIVMVK